MIDSFGNSSALATVAISQTTVPSATAVPPKAFDTQRVNLNPFCSISGWKVRSPPSEASPEGTKTKMQVMPR